MKRFRIIFIILFSAISLFAQIPHSFKYQTVVRHSSGEVISNQTVSFKISIHDGSAGGTIVYQETHSITTNQFGLANLDIAYETGFSDPAWFSRVSDGTKFLEIELDPTGSNSYVSLGTTQLLSVPYSLFSENAGGSRHVSDADGDTYITPELHTDEDTIRFCIAGIEKLKITDRSIEQTNIGNSVFIGKNAGKMIIK